MASIEEKNPGSLSEQVREYLRNERLSQLQIETTEEDRCVCCDEGGTGNEGDDTSSSLAETMVLSSSTDVDEDAEVTSITSVDDV